MSALDRDAEVLLKLANHPDGRQRMAIDRAFIEGRWSIAVEALRDISRQTLDFGCFCDPPTHGSNPCLACVINNIIEAADKEKP